MSKEWDRENMKSIGVNLKKETAESFKAYAEAQGTTMGALLRGFIEATVSGRNSPASPPPAEGGCWHFVTYRTEDKLKHETAFHNPGNKNPDEMLDYILEDYFQIAEHFRRKGK